MMDGRLLQRLRSERGTTLVEVIAAAIILVVVAGAVTSLISNAQNASGQSRVIAIAGDLAQSQLEDLRSKRFSDLQGLDATESVTAGGIDFTVRKSSAWEMRGASGAAGCTAAGRSPEALRVTVAVSWSSMRDPNRPVALDSLVAAPPGKDADGGDYIVQINRRDGAGVPAVPVQITNGITSLSGSTDENGCVRFNGLEEGPYTVSFSRPNFVDVSHQNAVSAPVTVAAGETGNKTFEYDEGGGVNVRFVKQTTSGGTVVAVPVTGATFTNANLTVTGVLDATQTIATEPFRMFPHSAQYQVAAEACPSAGSVGGVAVQRDVMDPPQVSLKLPQIRLRLDGLRSFSSQIDRTTLRARVQSPCGVVVSPAAGMTGTLSNTNGNPDRWTSDDLLVTPPGIQRSVCFFARSSSNSTWRWARATDLNVVATADATDHTGFTYVSGNHYDVDLDTAQASPDAASACPAL